MKDHDKKMLVIVAGGTGGHVYPALVVAENWQQRGGDVAWIGTREGLEAKIVPKHHISFYCISTQGLRRKERFQKWLAMFKMLFSFFEARKILKKLRPDVVLGMGGYVSGPTILAARSLFIPVVIHEQNAIAGKTNQIVARFSKKVLTAFPGVLTAYHPIVCGNPVRKDLFTLTPKPYASFPMKILIVGGSRGALSLNKTLPGMLASIPDITVWHQTGEKHYEETQKVYEKILGADGYSWVKLTPYLDDMVKAYEWADIVICRSGAMTVFEMMVVGRPAIFIPYPYAVDDHQTANANFLAERSAAFLIQEQDLSQDKLMHFIQALKEELNYQRYAKNAYAHRVMNADELLVQSCLEVLQ